MNVKSIDCVYTDDIYMVKDDIIIEASGEGVSETFANILYDIDTNELDSCQCVIHYNGTFGEDVNDEWCSTVKSVVDEVKELIINTKDLTDKELSVINETIDKYGIDKSKIKFV